MESIDMILFHTEYEREEALDNFLTGYFSAEMTHLASDLLTKGLSTRDIMMAIRKTVTICRTAGEDPRRHFLPIYTQYQGAIIKDCKLSHLGYSLTLLNAPEQLPVVAKFQLELLKRRVK